MINNFGNIYLGYNNHIELIKHNNSKNNPIKIITYKELLLELSSFETKTLNYFIEHGLNKNTNQLANLTLILTTMRNKTKLESHDFSYKDSNKNIIYDIPYFHKDVPEGFSVFCTDEEFDLVMSYICQLCRSRFDNYKQHIKSETHCKNIKKHQNAFNKLTSTFKRIIKNYLYNKSNNIYSTPIKEVNLGKELKNKENSYSKSFSSLLTNDSNNLIEFSPEDLKKMNKTYNLRIKKSPSFGRDYDDNYYYFMTSTKNNSIKIIKQENDSNSPPQQGSSTAFSTYKNNYMEDNLDNYKSKLKLNYKRKREDVKDNKGNNDKNFFDQINSKNKKIKK